MMDFVKVDSEDRPLLYSWAWLFALGELLVGGQARALATGRVGRVYGETAELQYIGLLLAAPKVPF